jgi:cytoplasmic iron level regulating protein YaaA (DUF328/UPF0246 family)
VLILLPPSEGKFGPTRGKPLDLDALSFPQLRDARQQVLDALVDLCAGDPEAARTVLGLPPGLAGEVVRNASLKAAPTALVSRIYTGVLYDALGLETLSAGAKRRAASRLLVTSSLFGVVRPLDRIPAYRLSGDVTLPGLGTVGSVWRQALTEALAGEADKRLIVDLRSGTYGAFWRPSKEQARRVVGVRVLQEVAGRRSVVSHFNKATKGRIVRAVLEDGADARSPQAFADLLSSLGWQVEATPGSTTSFDVIVTEIGATPGNVVSM